MSAEDEQGYVAAWRKRQNTQNDVEDGKGRLD